MRSITIELPDEVAHRLEVCAAIDDVRLAEGVVRLLTHIVMQFEDRREQQGVWS